VDGWTTDVRALPVAEPIEELTADDCEDGLSVKQMRAIDSLISGKSKVQTAAACEVSRRTVHEWLSKVEFQKVLRNRKRETMQSSMNLLQGASVELAFNLIQLAKTSPDPADKIRSTIAALRMAQEQTVNDEIVLRLDAIELQRTAGPTAGPTDCSTFHVLRGANES
jgi:predicted regulator of amino acid metabolism with ACT domain